jgi:hypothetical protein
LATKNGANRLSRLAATQNGFFKKMNFSEDNGLNHFDMFSSVEVGGEVLVARRRRTDEKSASNALFRKENFLNF